MNSIAVTQIQDWLQQGNRLVDIRDLDDQAAGLADQAQALTVDALRSHAPEFRESGRATAIMCYRGLSSERLCAELGSEFVSVVGGFQAYLAAGLPWHVPEELPMLRYAKQMKLSGFGQQAQDRLSKSSVLVVGAGGLGAPLLLYLVAAGVGRVVVADPDHVSMSNLHRQVLYTVDDLNLPKVERAKARLQPMNPDVLIESHVVALDECNAAELMAGVDLVIDGSDNVATRLCINDACNRLGKPWVFAAVNEYEWQLAVLKPGQPCYRCLFPDLTTDSALQNCSDAGVLGPVPGMAAMVQATEAIKYLAQLPGALDQQMIHHDLLHHEHKVLKYASIQRCSHHHHEPRPNS